MDVNDLRTLTDYCKAKLDLANANLDDTYYYQSLPLCVIDAVFSIGARYTSTENVVERFCKYFGLQRLSKIRYPEITAQLSVAEFINLYDQYGVVGMAENVYQNRQRTSTRSGILKSEAVLYFSQTLHDYGANYFQDIDKVIGQQGFEAEIKTIPGQGSGISLRYFYMLAGSDNYVKPDRMMDRFIQSALHKSLSIEEIHETIIKTCRLLEAEYPDLTPRALDNLIWNYQRKQK